MSENTQELRWSSDGSMVYLKHPTENKNLFELNVMTAFQSVKLADRMQFAIDLANLLTWVDRQLDIPAPPQDSPILQETNNE